MANLSRLLRVGTVLILSFACAAVRRKRAGDAHRVHDVAKPGDNTCTHRGLYDLSACGPCCDAFISAPAFAGKVRFVFLDGEAVQSCPEVAARAKRVVETSSSDDFGFAKPRDLALMEGVNGSTAWSRKKFFAAVQDEATGQAVAMFEGSLRWGDEHDQHVEQIGASASNRITGAAGWGLSMLFHFLKLRGSKTASLEDASEDDPAIIDGISYRTQGSRVYARMSISKRPYTFPMTREEDYMGLMKYTYNLGEEGAGSEYPAREPC